MAVFGGASRPFVKWAVTPPDTKFIGTYEGVRAGQFGAIIDFITEDGGRFAFGATAVLRTTLIDKVRPGSRVVLTYLGVALGKNRFHNFQVECADEDVLPPVPSSTTSKVAAATSAGTADLSLGTDPDIPF